MHDFKIKNITPYLLVILLFIGTGVLGFFSYDLADPSAPFFFKIHPATYLIFGILLYQIIIGEFSMLENVYNETYTRYYSICIVSLLLYLFVSDKFTGIAFIIDTLLVPSLLFSYLLSKDYILRKKIVRLSFYMIFINSIVGIFERIFSFHLFPIIFTYGDEFRSTALLGHPLNNALITFIFILYILVNDISHLKKNILLVILFTALICYGSRGSLAVSVLAFLIFYGIPLLFSKRIYYKNANKFVLLLLMAFTISLLMYLLLYTPLGERLTTTSFFDDSANVRLESLDIIDWGSLENYFWAETENSIEYYSYLYNVEIIENFWVVWILKFGLIFTIPIFIFLVFLLVRINKIQEWKGAFLSVFLFMLAAGTNNSLASYTSAISIFVILFSFPWLDNEYNSSSKNSISRHT